MTLAAGANSIVAKDTDLAGNTGTSAAVSYTLDTTAPTVAITSTGGVTNQASQMISGTVTETNETLVSGTTVELYDNGSGTALGTATVQADGSWSTTVTLAAGANSIVAKDTDVAGNPGTSAAVSYTLDTTAPTVAITSSGGVTNQASQLISGTVTETNETLVSGTTVDLYDNGSGTALGTATVQADGTWSDDGDAGGRRQQHSCEGHRLGRQPRNERGGELHARHHGADGCDHQQRRGDQPGEPDHQRDGDGNQRDAGHRHHGGAVRQRQRHGAGHGDGASGRLVDATTP